LAPEARSLGVLRAMGSIEKLPHARSHHRVSARDHERLVDALGARGPRSACTAQDGDLKARPERDVKHVGQHHDVRVASPKEIAGSLRVGKTTRTARPAEGRAYAGNLLPAFRACSLAARGKREIARDD